MQYIIILLSVAVFVLWMRDEGEGRKYRAMLKNSGKDQDQIAHLTSRVTVLEEILLDRDRRLRDGFRGL